MGILNTSPTPLSAATKGEKSVQAKPSKVVKTRSSFEDSNEEDQPNTLVNENVAPILGEPQTSASSTDANPLVVVLHLTAEPKLEEPPVKMLRVLTNIPAPTPLNSMGPMMEEEKRLVDLKAVRVKYEKALKKLTQAQRMAQEKELDELEAKRKQHIDRTRAEYIKCIEIRDDSLLISKFK
ncbi:hypothetical protein Tco_0562681 [Tanacetum coccineum]